LFRRLLTVDAESRLIDHHESADAAGRLGKPLISPSTPMPWLMLQVGTASIGGIAIRIAVG
jgi:hypothetical protein